ncbi:Uncharacterized protein BM_BM2001 [Brugia malayi]|uniref:Bm2001 n=3 Tax=Filarioidea TaxID=6295 RepID=A0A1P6BST3_BRUMA|nr:Uncharacterized protein BM_BM2001 [Brugia malayi]AAX18863.1 SXP-1 [Setaria digitata]ABW38023.1 antigen WbL2 [Wuchereria bancrofti]ABQ65357.1 L3SXP antigen [Brugia malayi]CRZ24899.1 Bm2001 [Brugia malayi]VIO93933.1 Uncharacterized protein BM_BM2001 [Brugia malayi]
MKYFIFLSIGLIAAASAQREAQLPQPEIPPFLSGAPSHVVKQFFDLLKADESKTDPQTEADIEAFIRRLGGDYQTRFEQFKQEIKKEKAQYEKIHQAALLKFSPAAREADAKMSAIADSTQLTNHQKTEQIKAIMDSLSEAVRKEILEGFNSQ